MKRIIFALSLVIVFSLIFAEADNRKPIMEYYNNQNFSNFLKAVSFYGVTNEVSKDYSSQTYLMSLYFNELNKTLDSLVANADSLAPGELFQTANTLLALGENEKAIALYERINTKTPKWSCPWRHKGQAYLKLKDFSHAEGSLLKAIETRKDHYDAYVMLSEVYYGQQNYKKAYDTMQEAFKYKTTGSEEAEEAYTSKDSDFIYLDILKANKMNKEAKNLEEKLKKQYPEDKRWK